MDAASSATVANRVARESCAWLLRKASSLRRLLSINSLAVYATTRNTANRKYDEGEVDSESREGRTDWPNATADRQTAKRPGPLPAKRLLTIMASTKLEDAALSGRGTTRAIPPAASGGH